MSYNISRVIELRNENFRFNIADLEAKHLARFGDMKGWRVEDLPFDGVAVLPGCDLEIEIIADGTLAAGGLTQMRGEFSGTFWRDVVIPSMASTTGKLELVLIWEEGDYIERVTVVDGQYSGEEYEFVPSTRKEI